MKDKIEEKNKYKPAIIGLAISTAILGATTTGLGIAYGVTQSQATSYSLQLENVYKKNYYDLVDSVNSADMKISKVLASNEKLTQAKLLGELSQTSKEMQSSIASLPLSSDNVVSSVRFINQMSGYTQILEDKVANGTDLDESDMQVLSEMHECLTEMKRYLNRMSDKMLSGYSILDASSQMEGDYNSFSVDFAQVKMDGTDYPTMIYDGPFSDSVVNQQVKGLSGKEVSKEEAFSKIDSVFKNVSSIKYLGQSKGKFETYNFSLKTSDENELFVQLSKIGGNILTVSGQVESETKNIAHDRAEKIALDFAKTNGVENGEVVWSEELDSQAYFNITPKQNNVVLYPDLVKVKVDMENGQVIGYDATTYFTNHTKRSLESASVEKSIARQKVKDGFNVVGERLVLAPLDFNRQVLCWEFETEHDGATYYFYINAKTGAEENILKVVETTDGSKLM